ncbi:DUF1194 domain-containing protein [Rhodovarius lipocyclicus]|uniref:DUF1194 domain-containing protein n=1 Tax=Rhodovarius lipocyclicus TaxID=268410 RepID=UPI00135B60DE|nr:DUF1194 domain-containing protein [Rhodovarius lipocyclicus]
MEPVDVALCLAIDVSDSVDFDEFLLMVGGLAAALREAEVIAAATAGPHGAVAVCAIFWADPGSAEVAVPWTRIGGETQAQAFAAALEDAPRIPRGGATGLGQAMVSGLAELARCPADATRLVLDVSGDGASNRGRAPGPVRDLGVAAGVTINGLAVLNEEPDLLAHYQAEVIGGPGSFALTCADYADFAQAMRNKLLREFRGALLA